MEEFLYNNTNSIGINVPLRIRMKYNGKKEMVPESANFKNE